jgi:hypothetical protein
MNFAKIHMYVFKLQQDIPVFELIFCDQNSGLPLKDHSTDF